MCGVAGIISTDPMRVREALARMSAAMLHRGPDDEGTELLPLGGATLGLAFRRLAIQDLSPAGHQPMWHPDSGDVIIFNGEIYNVAALREALLADGHVFRSSGDTEIVLHLLTEAGPSALTRLAGMFGTAFYDARRQRLLLARDPLGIKPIYVARGETCWLFASEVRALLASGLVSDEIDRGAVASYLAYGSVPEPLTFFKHIRAFPPGCSQWFDAAVLDGDPREGPQRYWSFPAAREDCDAANAEDETRRVMETSVGEHLISDVPVGIFLSAGIDSTIVAGLAARHTKNLRTFTIGFDDNADLSEGKLAAETARRLGTVHTDIQILAKDAEAAVVPWLEALDQPSVDGLNTFIISQAVRRQGIIVALSGLGGDELFAGYDSFSRVPQLLRTYRKICWLPQWGREALASVATLRKPRAVAAKATDMARSGGSLLELYLQMRRAMSDQQLATLGVSASASGLTEQYLPPAMVDELEIERDDPVWTISELESRLYMTNTLLRDSDANGMAHSLEIRVPFLDRRVIDFAFGLPGNVRRPDGAPQKHLLRRAFGEFLRPELLDRSKTGFTLPIGRWIAGPLREFCEDSLRTLKGLGILRPEGVDQVWNEFVSGGDTLRWSRAFSLCVLGAYARRLRSGAVRTQNAA